MRLTNAVILCFLIQLSLCYRLNGQTAPAPNTTPPATTLSAEDQQKASLNHPEPTDDKAKKLYTEAKQEQQHREYLKAYDAYRKANKADGGRCLQCEIRAWQCALAMGEFKNAREQAYALLDQVVAVKDKAIAHSFLGKTWLREGLEKHHDKDFEAAADEYRKILALTPNSTASHYGLGLALANLKQYDAAKEEFSTFLAQSKEGDLDRERAKRFSAHPEEACEKLAPNFRITTLDGNEVSLESLNGKVVLIDFWATWCGPCREALPHVKELAKKFEGRPFVVLSVSMDNDEKRWKEFVKKNNMTWLQFLDGRFTGSMATLFNVNAIPATFTIDADGVLKDQHVGDADIDGKIAKLIARAVELNQQKSAN